MVVAKNDRAHRHLSKQFSDKLESGLQRGYLALVWGAPDRAKGTIDAPLDRSSQNREKRAVREGGRDAITHWEMRERYIGPDEKPVASLLACMLETGRTHQIRVHLAHIGHPIMGDATYATGFKTKGARLGPRRALRSRRSGGKRCMPRCWALPTPSPAKRCGLNRPRRPTCRP